MDVWSKAEATSLKIDNGDQTYFVILSDVWLDEDSTLAKLEKMISGFGRNDILPSLIIFMGRFSKLEYSFGKNMSANYLAGFQRLSVMLSRHLKLLQQCELVFIPDARDPIPSSLYPLPALPEIFTSKIRSILPNAHFTTNPCRLRYSYSTEILLFKYDLIKKLGTHSIFPYPVTDEKSIRQVAAETILAQGTLLPFSNQQQAIAIGRESMLRFLPPPSLVVIGDTTQQYALTVEGMPVINPGSFSETRGNFIIYYPRSGDCELSSL